MKTTTISNAKKIISTLVQHRLDGDNPPPVFLWGPPGVGKSDCVRQVAAEKDIKVFDLRLSQMDPVDIRGVPFVEKIITKWAIPEFFPQDRATEGILFLDELSTAAPENQAAAYQLVLERQCGEYHLPPKVYICAAGNRAQDNAISIPMSSALANRMLHLEVEADPEAWCKWAIEKNIAREVVGFIHFRPEMLFVLTEDCERGWPSPRSWANVSKVLSYGFAPDDLRACVVGLVGENAAAQFLTYYRQSHELGDIREAMLNQKSKWKLPTKTEMRYAVATSIAYWAWHGENKDETEKLLDGFFRIGLQLPAVFAAVAMADALSGMDNDAHAKQMIEHKLYPEWQKKFATDNVKGGKNA